MKGVRIFGTDDNGNQVEIGRLLLKAGKVIPSNKATALETILEGAVPLADESGQVRATDDPEKFLEGLRYKYSGSYLRAGPVEEL